MLNPIEELAKYEKNLIEKLKGFIKNPDLWTYDSIKSVVSYGDHVLKISEYGYSYYYRSYSVKMPYDLCENMQEDIKYLAEYKHAEEKLNAFKLKYDEF